MSQLEILAGRINTLLDGLWILVYVVGAVVSLVCALMMIGAALCGDWTVRLALVSWIGLTLLGFVLRPLVPYGDVVSVLMTMLGFSVAWWRTGYHYR